MWILSESCYYVAQNEDLRFLLEESYISMYYFLLNLNFPKTKCSLNGRRGDLTESNEEESSTRARYPKMKIISQTLLINYKL